MSTNPKYFNEKVNLFVGFGPLTRMTKTSNLNKAICKVMSAVAPILPSLGIYDVLSERQMHDLLINVCGYFTGVCQFAIHYICTTNGKPIDYDRFRAYFGHYPAGSSVKCVTHFGQMMES